MQHEALHQLCTTSAVARAAGCSEGHVRWLADRGFVQPQRDSVGRRLFTHDDIARIAEYVAQRRAGRAA